MARAKRTDRAEARRRYRAQLATEDEANDVDAAEEATPESTGQRPASSRTAGPRTSGPAGRPAPQQSGMVYAFRAAFRPANLREDLANLPSILLSRAVLIPALVSVVTAAVFVASGGTEFVSRLLAQYFLLPPPIGAIFIAGFFAKRASYIVGAVVGLVAALAFSVVVFSVAGAVGPSGIGTTGASPGPSAATSPAASSVPGPSPSPAPGAEVPFDPVPVATSALVISPIAGIFFAAAAAWYRRFLKLANPNRAAARPSSNRGKPARRR